MMSRLSAVAQLGSGADSTDARVRVLAQVLRRDGFYGVRVGAASALGRIGSPAARDTLLGALRTQGDSRVRTAVASALGRFAGDSAVYAALVNALGADSSYAVEAAAARGLGRSGNAGAEPVLAAIARGGSDVHVMTAVLGALAATSDPRAAAVLLDESQPGVPEGVRAAALSALAAMQRSVPGEDSARVAAATRAALGDGAIAVRMAGEELAGAFGLSEFRADVARDADAPLIIQRRLAEQVLHELAAPGR